VPSKRVARHDHRWKLHPQRVKGDALRVIAGRHRDHAVRSLL
jgi:hypothetical protein